MAGASLVIGGDSLVGAGLAQALERRGHQVFATTRRKAMVTERRLFLDFEGTKPFLPPAEVEYVYVVAAATNYERCERDPLAYRINVELIPQLIGSLLKSGLFVTFISTNSVFGGERPWPGEDDAHAPGIAYARQKAAAESAISAAARELAAEGRASIVRLTKIMAATTAPLPAWFASWRHHAMVQPFADLIFAPLSVRFAGEALATLGERRIPGNLHLSGAENVSYVDFAYALSARLGVDRNLIAPTTATAKGVHIAFKPRYSGLGMQRTTALSGILPQPLASVVDDLLADCPPGSCL